MAQVTARKRGKTWEYRFEIASVEGKRKQKSKGGFRTKAEAMKAGTAAMNEYNNTGQVVSTDNQISVADFFDLWISEAVENHNKFNTVRNIRGFVDNHIKPEIGSFYLTKINHSAIQQLINRKAKDLSKNSVKRLLSTIHAGLEYAYVTKGLIYHNPADRVKIPDTAKKQVRESRAYSESEMELFFEKLNNDSLLHAAVAIAFFTGMRIGEICALTWDDVDMEKKTIEINKTLFYRPSPNSFYRCAAINSPKTKSSLGKIKFGETLSQILRRVEIDQKKNALKYGEFWQRNYIDESGQIYVTNSAQDGELRFILRHQNGSFYTPNALDDLLRKKIGDGFRFHNLRHTHATMLIAAGIPITEVQNRLRHSTASTTLDIYAEATARTQSEGVHAIEQAWTNCGQKTANHG